MDRLDTVYVLLGRAALGAPLQLPKSLVAWLCPCFWVCTQVMSAWHCVGRMVQGARAVLMAKACVGGASGVHEAGYIRPPCNGCPC